jgi:hypothetical protein
MNNNDKTPRVVSNDAYTMNYGIKRRENILKTIENYTKAKGCFSVMVGLPVNNKWQWSTKDSDLKYLIKKGILKQIRHVACRGRNGNTGLKKHGKSQTYLVLTKDIN